MRFAIALLFAFIIAVSMFLGMHFMISSDNKVFERTKATKHLVYLREKNDETIERKKRIKPKKIIEKTPTKKIKIIKTKINTKVNQNVEIKPFKVVAKNIDISSVSSLSGAQVAVSQDITKFIDANSLTALKRVNPRYPRRAKRRNIEGFVQLSFSIDHKGLVSNIKVLSANPAGVFESNAINAIKKWRFKANSVQNASITFNFRLTK